MTRHKADPKQFLAHLEGALSRVKPKDVVNQAQLAEVLGMSTRNLLQTYLKPDPDFPFIERGSEGKPAKISLVKALRHLIKQTRGGIEQSERRNAEQVRRLSFQVSEQDKGVSLADLRVQMDLTLRIQAQKREQNDKVDAGEVGRFLGGLNETIRDTIMGTGGVIDPIGDMEPERRAVFDDHMRDLVLTVQRRIGNYIEEHCARSIEAGNI